MEIKVTVPASTQAVVGVPAAGVKIIKLNGKPVWKDGKYLKNATSSIQLPDGRIGFEIATGEWSFITEN